MDKYSGEAIVGRSFAKLHTTPQVESALNRAKIRGKDVNRNSSKSMIKAYLDRFEELEHKPEPVKERLLGHLKTTLHNGVIIKSENVLDSHFVLQVKIAREQGYGALEITDQMRQLESQRIIADQKKSFDIWVDYMASKDAPYPVWFKYLTGVHCFYFFYTISPSFQRFFFLYR